ncbi:MAG: RNA polymerase sigma factor [Candidatus Promineifilaceae bacterium]|jgi:RNA polymerase sigma-70 factor (ECF subfamily)
MSDFSSLTWDSIEGAYPSNGAELNFLIERCLSGDDAAYTILYERHAGLIYRLAYSLLQNRQDAEEVLQDSFEYAFRKLADFDEEKSAFTTWLYRITVSRCRNKRRRKWLPTMPLSFLAPYGVKDENARSPDELLEQTEIQRDVWDALGRLSPKLRETAVLRYYTGMQYKEIGAILNISPKTAESRMRLAHKKLREIIPLHKMDKPE